MSSCYLLVPKDGLENTYFNWQARSMTFLHSGQTTGILIHLLATDSTPWALAEFRVLVELRGLINPVKPLSYTVCYCLLNLDNFVFLTYKVSLTSIPAWRKTLRAGTTSWFKGFKSLLYKYIKL